MRSFFRWLFGKREALPKPHASTVADPWVGWRHQVRSPR